eukprot:361082-Chlamydomonas_euryale.AAC.4
MGAPDFYSCRQGGQRRMGAPGFYACRQGGQGRVGVPGFCTCPQGDQGSTRLIERHHGRPCGWTDGWMDAGGDAFVLGARGW